MTFSREWDQTYRDGKQLSIWPWSDLVSHVYRYARPGDGFRRVLELGCGAGANIPFFLKLGVSYSAVEGSAHIVAALKQQYPEIADRLLVGDFTEAIPFAGPFDLVVDRASVTHNTTAAILRTLAAVNSLLRAGGKFIGIDWFSTIDPDFARGEPLDAFTRSQLSSHHFAGLGAVHFSDRNHLTELFEQSGFAIEQLDHKRTDRIVPASDPLGSWNLVAVKP